MDASIDFAALRREREQRYGPPVPADVVPPVPAETVIREGPGWHLTSDGKIFRDGKFCSQYDPPLDPDSENEVGGEEQDDHDVWHNAVWRNQYDFEFGDSIRRGLPSKGKWAVVAAAATGAATVAAVAEARKQVRTRAAHAKPH
jgi:hypothetical protein